VSNCFFLEQPDFLSEKERETAEKLGKKCSEIILKTCAKDPEVFRTGPGHESNLAKMKGKIHRIGQKHSISLQMQSKIICACFDNFSHENLGKQVKGVKSWFKEPTARIPHESYMSFFGKSREITEILEESFTPTLPMDAPRRWCDEPLDLPNGGYPDVSAGAYSEMGPTVEGHDQFQDSGFEEPASSSKPENFAHFSRYNSGVSLAPAPLPSRIPPQYEYQEALQLEEKQLGAAVRRDSTV
jgi:hypothetical protein